MLFIFICVQSFVRLVARFSCVCVNSPAYCILIMLITINAVSYTHLDVYKRQVLVVATQVQQKLGIKLLMRYIKKWAIKDCGTQLRTESHKLHYRWYLTQASSALIVPPIQFYSSCLRYTASQCKIKKVICHHKCQFSCRSITLLC